MARIRPTWILTVPSDRCRAEAISRLDRPAASSAKTVRSRSVSLLSRASWPCCRPGSGSRGANWSISRRVAEGARTASPAATVRTAESSSAGGASLSRNPLAPALSPAKTYWSRSKVVRIRTRLAVPGGGDRRGRRDPVQAGHADVHQHHVGLQGGRHADPGRAVRGLAGHLDVGLGLQDQPESHPEQGLIVHEQDPDHAARRRVQLAGPARRVRSPESRWRRAETFQPPGWPGPACTSPP